MTADTILKHAKALRTPKSWRYTGLLKRVPVPETVVQEEEKPGESPAFALLRQAQAALERAETRIKRQDERITYLETLTITDELTGLFNGRGFYQEFLRELDRTNRGPSQGGLLVLIDVDNYNALRDEVGQAAGIEALRAVASKLKTEIRQMDCAARLEGDNFVLLLADTSRDKALGRAQKLAWELNHLELVWNDIKLPINVSLGLQDYKAGDRAEDIFNRHFDEGEKASAL